jgi:hypothetical protein
MVQTRSNTAAKNLDQIIAMRKDFFLFLLEPVVQVVFKKK